MSCVVNPHGFWINWARGFGFSKSKMAPTNEKNEN
jgi:hypothetical protein